MIYSEHDLAYNLNNALAVGDKQSAYDILISEIGNLMRTNKPALVRAIQQAGGKIPNDVSDEKLAEAVSEALVKNKGKASKALNNIAAAIVREKSKYSNASDIVTGVLEVVNGAVNAATEITKAKLNADSAKNTAKAAVTTARLGITDSILKAKGNTDQAKVAAQIEREKGQSKSGHTMIIVGGVVVTVLIGVIGFIMYKRSNSGSSAPASAPAK